MSSLFAMILAASSMGPSSGVAGADAKMLALVRQLGHKSFAVREAASRELVKAGGMAMPALRDGIKDADAEVAQRCRKLIPLAQATERTALLSDLLKEPLGPPPRTLAGAERFLKITGDSPKTRQLYAKMLTENHQIIETLEVDPRRGSQLMNDFVVDTFDQWQKQRRPIISKVGKRDDEPLTGTGQAALIMFVRSDPNYLDDNRQAIRVNRLASSRHLADALAGNGEVPGMRKLFLHWLAVEPRYFVLLRMFQIAEKAGMKEALPTLLAIAGDKKRAFDSRLDALVAIGRMGGKECIPELAAFLGDKSDTGTFNLGDGPMLVVQVRDVALIVNAHLAGEELHVYGYDSARFGIGAPSAYHACGFPDDKSRDKAHARWKERAPGKKSGDRK